MKDKEPTPLKPCFYIDKVGTVRYNEFPEEPKKWEHGDSLSYNEAAWQVYNEALQAAKDSAVEFSDQGQAKQILFERFCIFPAEYKDRLDTIHIFPSDKYKVEVKDEVQWNRNTDRNIPTNADLDRVKLAFITPLKDEVPFNGCSPTACGCKTKDDCPNKNQFLTASVFERNAMVAVQSVFVPKYLNTEITVANESITFTKVKDEVGIGEKQQEYLWRELIDLYDTSDRNSYGYGSLIKALSEKYTITRKPNK